MAPKYPLGAVILYKNGPNLISKFIRLIQGNPYTHCAVVVEAHDENPLLLEIANTFSRSRFVRLYDTWDYTDKISVAVNAEIEIPATWKDDISALGVLNRKYSTRAILNAAINHGIGRLLGFVNIEWKYRNFLFPSKERFTCSALLRYTFDKLTNLKCENPWISEPDDFTTSSWSLTCVKDSGQASTTAVAG